MLDQLLRAVTNELVSSAGIREFELRAAAPRGAVSNATMGQCLTILERFSGRIEESAAGAMGARWVRCCILTNTEVQAWRELIQSRNRLLHNGPGYVDSVDLFAGRFFNGADQLSEEGRAELANAIWTRGKKVCESEAAILGVLFQGMTRENYLTALRHARGRAYETPSGETLGKVINGFHGK